MSNEDRLTLQLLVQKLRKRYWRIREAGDRPNEKGKILMRELELEIEALERVLA